jgi:site-specific recombinase XerD
MSIFDNHAQSGYNVSSCICTGVTGTIDSKGLLEQFQGYLLGSALAPATVVNYLADLRAFLRWGEKTRDAACSPFSLTTPDIQEYCLYLQEDKGHTPATINRRIQALRKFYEQAVTQGWTLTNPAEKVSLLREVASERSRSLTAEDVTRLLAAVQRNRTRWSDRDWVIIQILVGAGLKISELIELRLSDVYLEASEPRLHVHDATGNPGRMVPLAVEVCQALSSYLPTRRASPNIDHLCVNRDGNPLSTRSVQRLLDRYAKAAGLDGLTAQALRYMYAKRVYDSSGDLKTVAQLLGHRHLATTIRYLRPSSPQGEQPLTESPTES